MKRFVAVVCVGLLLGLAAPGQVAKSGKGYLLRMKWAKEDSYSYVMTMTSPAMKDPMTIGQFTVKVLSVSGGIANVNYTGTMLGQPQMNATAKMDSRGAVDVGANLRALGGPRLPEKAVSVGEKWTVEQEQTVQGTQMKVTSTYTFKGLQAVGKVSCAVLDVSTATTGVVTKSTGKLYLEASNGQLYKMEMDTVVGAAQGGGQQLKTKTAIARK